MARGSIHKRTLRDGAARYDAIIRIGGKQKKTTHTRKLDAERWLNQVAEQVRLGTYQEIRPATFREYAAHWDQAHAPKRRQSTLTGYRSIMEAHLLPALGDLPLTAIGAAEINALAARLRNAGRKPQTVRNVLALLRRVLTLAVSEDFLTRNPMDKGKVEIPKATGQKGRGLTPDECRALLEACASAARLAVATALLTGMRQSEQFGLDWQHVDFDGGCIQVKRRLQWNFGTRTERAGFDLLPPKTEYGIRDIDLSPFLSRMLREHYLRSAKTGLVFQTSRGTPWVPGNFVSRHFRPAVRKAGLEPLRWHDLRHTFGSLKLLQGESVYYVQRQMGHSSIRVTCDVYGHLLEERRPEAAAKTDSLLFGQM